MLFVKATRPKTRLSGENSGLSMEKKMKSTYFNAVKPCSIVGDGTVGDLVDWLKTYVDVVFPENGIEYFADHAHSGANALKRFQKAPVCVLTDEGIHHVACYVREGNCEGMVIEVAFYLRSERYLSLTWIKSFGTIDECWAIARAIGEALTSITTWTECPEIVDMAMKVPKKHRWDRSSSLTEEVIIAQTMDSLTVSTVSGLVLDNRSWKEEGIHAHYSITPYVKDWVTVLTNMNVSFRVVTDARVFVEDLPGYLISNRGVKGCTGFYVLPPGGNPLDDRQYIGYFLKADAAIEAARGHKQSQNTEQSVAA